ncbi:MAG: glycosyl hydrolase family 18 protein [Clostridia bacterium]|nr:glycosyl hydrolase family 18 protein [Clostridia bacterium]
MLAAYCFGRLDQVTEEDIAHLDLINIAFGTIRDGLLYYAKCKESAEYISRWHALKPEFKVLLSIGGWGAGGFSMMCSTPEGIRAFTETCMTAIDDMGLDGIDLDWEYPTSDAAGIDASPDDCQNFTALLRSLREAMDAKYDAHKMLTIAVSGKLIENSMEYAVIPAYLDYVSLMTYDLAWGYVAKHHTALNPTEVNAVCAKSAVAEYSTAGIPMEKLVVGAAFYSRMWDGVEADDAHPLGLGNDMADHSRIGGFGPGYGGICEECLDENGCGKNGWIAGRDNGAPYLYHPEKKTFLSYDDAESIRAKVAYVHEMGLAGVMYWEHSHDPKRILLTAMWEEEHKN